MHWLDSVNMPSFWKANPRSFVRIFSGVINKRRDKIRKRVSILKEVEDYDKQ